MFHRYFPAVCAVKCAVSRGTPPIQRKTDLCLALGEIIGVPYTASFRFCAVIFWYHPSPKGGGCPVFPGFFPRLLQREQLCEKHAALTGSLRHCAGRGCRKAALSARCCQYSVGQVCLYIGLTPYFSQLFLRSSLSISSRRHTSLML